MKRSKESWILILLSGLAGLLNGTQQFLIPIALIYYQWSLLSYTTVFAFQALAMGVPFLFAGFYSDLKGRRETIAIGFICYTVGMILFIQFIASNFLTWIIVAQMLSTFSFSISRLGISTLIADITGEGQDRTSVLGDAAAFRNLFGFIGIVTMGFLLSGLSTRFFDSDFDFTIIFSLFGYPPIESAFIILLGLGILSSFSYLILPKTSKEQIVENRMARITHFTPEQMKMQRAFLIQELILGFTSGAIVPLMDYYVLTTFQPSTFVWSLVFGISNSSIALGSVLLGRYAEKIGKGKVIVQLNAVAPLMALGIALSPTFGLVAFFYIARSALANSIHPAWEAWYYSHTLKSARGRSFSIIQFLRRLSRATGVASGSGIFALFGPLAFPLISVFYPLAMLIPFREEKKISKKNSIETLSEK
jgi:MFS family permease